MKNDARETMMAMLRASLPRFVTLIINHRKDKPYACSANVFEKFDHNTGQWQCFVHVDRIETVVVEVPYRPELAGDAKEWFDVVSNKVRDRLVEKGWVDKK